MKTKSQSAFTLIELLVVVAIVGMLTSIIGAGFGNVRQRSRDAKRLSDMNQIKLGMDLYYSTAAGYPDETVWNTGIVDCNGTKFMEVPRDPLINVPYEYTTDVNVNGVCGNVWRNYYITLTTEGKSDIGPAGTYYYSNKGFSDAAPF